jgi:hypothetical protein
LNNTTLNSENQEGVPEKIASSPGWIVHPHHCPKCGNGQTLSDRCERCGTPFPSFTVNVSSADPGNNRKPVGIPTAKTSMFGISTAIKAFPAIFGKMPQRVRITTIFVSCVLLVSLLAGITQYRSYLQSRYLQSYVLALYGIKSGMDMTARVCDGKYLEWKEGVSSASATEGIDTRALADLAAVKTEIGAVMGSMGTPPVECEQSARTLERLYSVYDNINSLVIKFHGSLSGHKSEIDASREAFSREVGNLKANLPASLAAEIKKEGRKYDLRFMGLGV